jgi:hypothetical protein
VTHLTLDPTETDMIVRSLPGPVMPGPALTLGYGTTRIGYLIEAPVSPGTGEATPIFYASSRGSSWRRAHNTLRIAHSASAGGCAILAARGEALKEIEVARCVHVRGRRDKPGDDTGTSFKGIEIRSKVCRGHSSSRSARL